MIVDTSAIMAILLDEPEADVFRNHLGLYGARLPAGCWVELSAVLTRSNRPQLLEELGIIMQQGGIEVASCSAGQAQIAHDAYRTYGIGSGHKAKLNLGDCFAYALARDTGQPLLFKGDDFVHTDIEPALR